MGLYRVVKQLKDACLWSVSEAFIRLMYVPTFKHSETNRNWLERPFTSFEFWN